MSDHLPHHAFPLTAPPLPIVAACRFYVFQKLWLHEWICPEDALVEEGGSARTQGNKEEGLPVEPAPGAGPDNKRAETGRVGEETCICDGMEDVYAIGFQELVDLNAVNVAIDIRSQVRLRQILSLTRMIARQTRHVEPRTIEKIAMESRLLPSTTQRDSTCGARKTA